MCVMLRNAIYFHLYPAHGLAHPVCTHAVQVSLGLGWHQTRCWLYGHPRPGTVCLLATTWTVSLVPGTASLAPVMVHLAPPGMYGKPGTGDGEPEPGTHDQGAPSTVDGRARDGTSAGNNMDREPGTGDGKPGTRDCAVQCTCARKATE